jgi:NAD(P)-dependent dehydrogenase (short-subunit alcohol dehydrogenase family)
MTDRNEDRPAPLADKRILVVGASAGIGRGVATAAVADGAKVAFCSRRQQALEDAVKRAGGGTPITADVRDEAQVEQLLSSTAEALGGLDAFVYVTGYSGFGMLAELDAEEWRRVLETNTVGASLVARFALPHLRASSGVGFFISSEAVGRPRPGLVHYSASKAALEEVVRGFQTECTDLRFTRVTVGQTLGTEFGGSFEPGQLESVMPRWLAEGHMNERYMDADDLGRAIVELLTTQIRHPGVDLQTAVLRSPGPAAGPGDLVPNVDFDTRDAP